MNNITLTKDHRSAGELIVRGCVFLAWILLSLELAKYIAITIHWPLIRDTQEMLYINFLIRHGMVPYRDLTDINMPGVYLFHAIAARVFGPSDLDWRLCEFFLNFVLIAAMTLIARPYGLLAGLLAGVLFILLHASQGPTQAVQRDEIVAVFAMAGYAALFESVRRQWPWLCLVFGFLFGFAITVKPPIAPLALVAVLLSAYGAKRQNLKVTPYFLCGVAGLAAGLMTSVLYLWSFHAGDAFFFSMKNLLFPYMGSKSATWAGMLAIVIRPFRVVLVLALAAETVRYLSLRNSKRAIASHAQPWEMLALFCGAIMGLLSYLLQHKGFPYQTYPFYVFLLLLASLWIVRALRVAGLARWLAIASLLYAVLWSGPSFLRAVDAIPKHDPFSTVLAADLRQLNVARLDRQVQCMDIVFGCMTALYHDQIVQYSGYTGDLLLFVPFKTPPVVYYRNQFLTTVTNAPPSVFVVTNQRWIGDNSFSKLDNWPEFKSYLNQNYVLATQRRFTDDAGPFPSPLGSDSSDMAYRIYIRKSSPLLADAPPTQTP